MIEFKVIGIPRPQARPRIFVRNGIPIAHSPKTDWYGIVYHTALHNRPETPLDGPLLLTMSFVMPRPKCAKNVTWMRKRPDLDNLEKAVMDAMTQARIWGDDGQISEKKSIKRYPEAGEDTGVYVTVKCL